MLSDASSQAVSSTSDSLDDEYGEMTSDGQTYRVPERFVLESGRALDGVEVRYATYGELNAARTNCVVVCHALTGNHDLASWWGEMLGSGNVFDTDKFFVVCANMLGSCYGTTGPTSFDSRRQRRYGASFPDVTVRDSVRAHCAMVTRGLGVRGVACVVGGSLGGMQALEWGAMYGPDAAMPLVRSLVVLCAGSHHHAWQIGVSEAQRQAIYADPDWREGDYDPARPPRRGLSVARQIAMFTYRSHPAYTAKFGRKLAGAVPAGERQGQETTFDVEQYLRYQGQKFLDRFDALSYVKLTRTMDSHDLGRGRAGGVRATVAQMGRSFAMRGAGILVVGVSSDILYPVSEQRELVEMLNSVPSGGGQRHAAYFEVTSNSGHDGFLLDSAIFAPTLRAFLDNAAALRIQTVTARL